MRVMTARTLSARVMLVRINAFDFRPLTGRISKESVAPEAKFSGSV
jgi:hypothetical protein